MNAYKIDITKRRFGSMNVILRLPTMPGIRRLDNHKIVINIGEDGTINTPATGSLCATEDIPALLEAIDIAAKIARGEIVVQDMELTIPGMVEIQR